MLRVIGESDLPDDLSVIRYSGRAIGAEMDVDTFALDDRRGRSEAVLRILQKARRREHLNVDDLSTGLHVVAENAKGCPALTLDRRRQPDPVTGNNRGRPAAPCDRCLPENVLRFTPLQR